MYFEEAETKNTFRIRVDKNSMSILVERGVRQMQRGFQFLDFL